jgi:(p)ppGpp synthase/HD superfamily hydrolase
MKNKSILHAAIYATIAHGEIEQTRKYPHKGEGSAKLPYIVHPLEVAEKVAGVTQDVDMIIAAILHDVVEDTNRTIKDVEREFGGKIAKLVAGLTDVSRPGDGNRKVRKEMDRKHLKKGCGKVHTVKLADVLCNGYDIMDKDPDFAHVYMREIKELVKVLVKGHAGLLEDANKMIEDYYANRYNK